VLEESASALPLPPADAEPEVSAVQQRRVESCGQLTLAKTGLNELLKEVLVLVTVFMVCFSTAFPRRLPLLAGYWGEARAPTARVIRTVAEICILEDFFS
jgi:hypothetical protein